MNQSESRAECMSAITGIRSHANVGASLVSEAAVKVVTHCQTYGDAEPLNKMVDLLDETGIVKTGAKALRYLAFNFTGAKKDGTIDTARQNKGKETYVATCEAVTELGLVPWYESATGTGKAELTDEEKAAKKEAKAATQAMNWLEKQAKAGGLTGAKCKAMLEYGAKYEKLYDANPQQARDQLEGDLRHMSSQLAGMIQKVAS